jgi:hypothetical protein
VELVVDLLADGLGYTGGGGEVGEIFGNVEVSFVEGEGFDDGGVAFEDGADG